MLDTMDADELSYQIALDRVEGDELAARSAGVPTVTETMAVPPGRRIGRSDPNWFKKLEAAAAR